MTNMKQTLAILILSLGLSACSLIKTEMPSNEGQGPDLMRPSPCACTQLDFDSDLNNGGFQWNS